TRPWNGNDFTRASIPGFTCPSDGRGKPSGNDIAPISFHINRGDFWLDWNWWECRGVAGNRDRTTHSFATVNDGTSNTMLISECRIGQGGSNSVATGFARDIGGGSSTAPGVCLSREGPNGTLTGAVQTGGWFVGARWADSHAIYSQFHAVLPPNSPSCGNDGEHWAMISAGSYHPGGVNAVFCDGSVHFISETIDCGDPNVTEATVNAPGRPQDYTGPSLRGVWGALASQQSGEVVTVP
ncbi:MAG: DUF1559 domain-containing protein, partial [Planctomycetales bacterium]